MGSKARCSVCRRYFPKDEFLRTGLGGLGGICGEECLVVYIDKYRNKRVRRKENRERKFTGGRRLPGTCRDRVKRRDGGKCRWCGADQNVELHHVRYRSEGGPDTPKNLLSLCDREHERAHSDKKKYQPILLTWLWLYYVKEHEVTVETVFRLVEWYQDEYGFWRARKHQDWVDAAQEFSDEVMAKKQKAA